MEVGMAESSCDDDCCCVREFLLLSIDTIGLQDEEVDNEVEMAGEEV